MNMVVEIKERRREQSAIALQQALAYLEREAQSSGFKEIALLIGCAKMALDEAMTRPVGEALH
ncbi:MAG: hypothetical protein AB1918_11720 [Pseudomonadota bacterium]